MGRIRQAKRSSAKPLIGIYAESGNGKTYSSLILARGFVGKEGRICMIETESGRGESYADPTEYPEIGGYDVLSLHDNFSPSAYNSAIEEIEKAGYDALIIDSASHEWEGVGGVLDMAAQNQANGKKGPIVWQKPKIDHQKLFMLKVTQTSIPLVILNMRAKYPMQEIVKNGKKQWARSEVLDPKQSEDILYEMFVHGWIDSNHLFHPTKVTGKGLYDVFADGRPISLDTGSQLSKWAKGATAKPEPETHEEKMKALAQSLSTDIRNMTSHNDLNEFWNMDAVDDIAKVKEFSDKAYEFIENKFNDRVKELANDS